MSEFLLTTGSILLVVFAFGSVLFFFLVARTIAKRTAKTPPRNDDTIIRKKDWT